MTWYPHSRFIRTSLGAIMLVLSNVAEAQKPPTADQVIARHEAAVGGRPALDAHTSLRMTGVVILSMDEIRGTIEIVRAKPNKYVEKMSLAKIGDMFKGYDGKTAWVIEDSEPALLTDADADGVKRLADWYHEFIVTQAMRGARVDSAEYDGQPAWRLTFASGLGDETEAYFHQETGLRIAEVSQRGVGEAITTFGDYKVFAGVKLPTRIESKRSGGEILMNILTVEFDKVPASAFALPPSVKAIAK